MFNDDCKLFVAGLADGVTEESLKELFQSGGHSVVQVSIPRDRETGRVRGIAFLTMATAEDATAVREGLDGSLHMGRTLLVRPYEREAPKRSERTPGMEGPPSRFGANGPASASGPRSSATPTDRQIYVGNLPYDCSTEEVESLVNGLGGGQVQRVHLPTDPDGRKRGFGFVTMASAEDARAAVDGLATADLRGRRVNAKLAQPKGERPPPREGGGYGGGGYGGGGYGGPSSSNFGGGFPPPSGGPAPAKRPDDKRKKTGNSWDDGPRKPRFSGGGKSRGGGGGGWGGDDDE